MINYSTKKNPVITFLNKDMSTETRNTGGFTCTYSDVHNINSSKYFYKHALVHSSLLDANLNIYTPFLNKKTECNTCTMFQFISEKKFSSQISFSLLLY